MIKKLQRHSGFYGGKKILLVHKTHRLTKSDCKTPSHMHSVPGGSMHDLMNGWMNGLPFIRQFTNF